MVSVTDNKALWDGTYVWGDAGDEWSAPWGSPEMQWYGTVLPRIRRWMPPPDGTILELACGYGRWTQFLRSHAARLVGIDLSAQCIDACRRRFAGDPRLEFVQNDGKSLASVPDGSVDFLFSFDSLVHADLDVLEAYFAQLPRILRRDAVAFVHHSNAGACSRLHRVPKLRYVLRRLGLLEFSHLRDLTVTAGAVDSVARNCGLACIRQEVHTWLTRRTWLDCFSVLVRRDSPLAADGNIVIRNPHFQREASGWQHVAPLYDR